MLSGTSMKHSTATRTRKLLGCLAGLALVVATGVMSLLSGCGSGGSGAGAPATGSAVFKIQWPSSTTQTSSVKRSATGRLIPSTTVSIQISILQDNKVIASQIVNAPAAGQQSLTQTTFTQLPVALLTATATAYPEAGAQGVALATGSVPLTVQPSTPGSTPVTVIITMQSTIDHITIVPVPPGGSFVVTGQSEQVVATAYDASGSVILIPDGAITWSTDQSFLTVVPVPDANGLPTLVATVTGGTTPGLAHAIVTYSQSDVVGTQTIKQGSIAITVVAQAGSTSARFGYSTNLGANTITSYGIDPDTGLLTGSGSVATGTGPQSLTIDTQKRFVYVANSVSNSISAFTIGNVTGSLTALPAITGNPFSAGSTPVALAADPQGEYLYAANGGSDNISVYAINTASGSLSPLTAPVPTGAAGVTQTPASMVADPTGSYLYVANSASGTVSIFSISIGTGTLALIGTVSTGGVSPKSVSIDSTDHFLFVANLGSNNVSVFTLDPTTGQPTINPTTGQYTSPVVVSSASPVNLAAYSAAGGLTFLYVVNRDSNTVSEFGVGTGGRLSSLGAAVATGNQPSAINVEPNDRFVYVTNYLDNNVSEYAINPASGVLTPAPPSVLSGTGPSAFISTTGAVGSAVITAR